IVPWNGFTARQRPVDGGVEPLVPVESVVCRRPHAHERPTARREHACEFVEARTSEFAARQVMEGGDVDRALDGPGGHREVRRVGLPECDRNVALATPLAGGFEHRSTEVDTDDFFGSLRQQFGVSSVSTPQIERHVDWRTVLDETLDGGPRMLTRAREVTPDPGVGIADATACRLLPSHSGPFDPSGLNPSGSRPDREKSSADRRAKTRSGPTWQERRPLMASPYVAPQSRTQPSVINHLADSSNDYLLLRNTR